MISERSGSFILLHNIFLYAQIINYEILPFRGVLAHEELKHLVQVIFLGYGHRVESDVRTNKMLEFIW